MKLNRSIIWMLVFLIVVSAVYRVIPGRPWGFAPQWAMALFAGMMIKDRKWALGLPVFSMFLSDVFYQILFVNGLSEIPGFYEGQWQNYLLFVGLTCLCFLVKRFSILNVFVYSLVLPTVFFLVSNLLLWANGGGYQRSLTWAGLLQCYTDGLPFYRTSLVATVCFSVLFFGFYYFINKPAFNRQLA